MACLGSPVPTRVHSQKLSPRSSGTQVPVVNRLALWKAWPQVPPELSRRTSIILTPQDAFLGEGLAKQHGLSGVLGHCPSQEEKGVVPYSHQERPQLSMYASINWPIQGAEGNVRPGPPSRGKQDREFPYGHTCVSPCT